MNIATRSKDATRSKSITTRRMLLGAPGRTTRNKDTTIKALHEQSAESGRGQNWMWNPTARDSRLSEHSSKLLPPG